MTHFITAVSNRRTNYTLSKDVTIPQETIVKNHISLDNEAFFMISFIHCVSKI